MANYSRHVRVLPKEQTGEEATVADRLAKRLKEWARTPLNVDDERATLAVALVLLGGLVVPGLLWSCWRPRSCSEFYLLSYLAVSTLTGGPTGVERYALPVVPLLLYYGYASLRLWGRAAGSLFGGRRGAVVVPRVLVSLAGIAALAYGVNIRVRCKRGASKFSAKRWVGRRRSRATWEAAAAAVKKHVHNGEIVFPSSGNTWAKLHYFAECRVTMILSGDMGSQCLRSMLARRAKYLFTDNTNGRSRERVGPLLKDHGECFEPVAAAEGGEWALYRINAARVREELARLEGPRPGADGPAAP